MRKLFYLGCVLLLSGCSDDQQDNGHVWQEQTNAIEKAENVNKQVEERFQEQREAIEQQSQ